MTGEARLVYVPRRASFRVSGVLGASFPERVHGLRNAWQCEALRENRKIEPPEYAASGAMLVVAVA